MHSLVKGKLNVFVIGGHVCAGKTTYGLEQVEHTIGHRPLWADVVEYAMLAQADLGGDDKHYAIDRLANMMIADAIGCGSVGAKCREQLRAIYDSVGLHYPQPGEARPKITDTQRVLEMANVVEHIDTIMAKDIAASGVSVVLEDALFVSAEKRRLLLHRLSFLRQAVAHLILLHPNAGTLVERVFERYGQERSREHMLQYMRDRVLGELSNIPYEAWQSVTIHLHN